MNAHPWNGDDDRDWPSSDGRRPVDYRLRVALEDAWLRLHGKSRAGLTCDDVLAMRQAVARAQVAALADGLDEETREVLVLKGML